jgi:hypothetical protein
MKSKLIALMMVAGFGVEAQQITGTILDLDSGRIQAINATVAGQSYEPNRAYNEQMQRLRAMNAELEYSINSMTAEYYAKEQVNELREQTRLLRKIANQ